MKIEIKKLLYSLTILTALLVFRCKPKEYAELKPLAELSGQVGDTARLTDYSNFSFDLTNHPYDHGFRVYLNGKLYAGDQNVTGLSNVIDPLLGSLSAKSSLKLPDSLRGKEVEVTLTRFRGADSPFDPTTPPASFAIRAKGKFNIPLTGNFNLLIIPKPATSTDPYPFILLEDKISSAAPAPQNFKLRVINFLKPVSLTYADGSPVAGLTSVSYPSVSDYVEIPYGTYLFRAKDNGGNFITSSLPSYFNADNFITVYADLGAYKYFSIQPFKAGGLYTMYINADGTNNIITDKIYDHTNDFGKLAVYNASNENIDGIQLDGGQNISEISPFFKILNTGSHTINVTSGGKTSLSFSNVINYLDNTVVYLTKDKDDKQDYCKVNYYFPLFDEIYQNFYDFNVDKDQNIITQVNIQRVRFLNLSPDAGDVSFVGQLSVSGQTYKTLIDPVYAANLSYKEIIQDTLTPSNPYDQKVYVNYGTNFSPGIIGSINAPDKIFVYASTENPNLPGAPLPIPPIDKPFIDPLLPSVGNQPGVYTVALIGSKVKGTLKLISIKHNK